MNEIFDGVIIDPGHGGSDSGARGENVFEKDYNLLISKYKALGAAISTVIAEFTVTLIQILFIRKDFKIWDIIKSSFDYFISSIVMFIACMVIDVLIEDRMVALIVQVSSGVLIYFAMLRIMKDKLFIELIGHLKKMVHIHD